MKCPFSTLTLTFSCADNASGGAYDWTKLKAGIKYSYTYELRPGAYTNVGGFIQPVSEIKPTAVEIIASLREFAKMSLPCRP